MWAVSENGQLFLGLWAVLVAVCLGVFGLLWGISEFIIWVDWEPWVSFGIFMLSACGSIAAVSVWFKK